MKYEFHVGDYVETKDGRIGYITKICHCEVCKARGFYEPYVRYNDGEEEYITVHEVEHFQDFYNRIGQYDFTKRGGVKIHPLDYTEHFIRESAVDTTLIRYMRKINELVDAVNELREAKKNADN